MNGVHPSKLPKMREAGTYKLLLKPNGQQALIKGLARAIQRGADLDTAIARADRIDWADMAIWENILIKPNGGMIARTEAYNHAAAGAGPEPRLRARRMPSR